MLDGQDDPARARPLLERHGLWEVRSERVGSYSRGMTQRLALCRALPSLENLLALPRQKLDDVGGRLGRSLRIEVAKKRERYLARYARA